MVADCSRFSCMRATSPVVFCWQEGRWSCGIVWIKGAGVSWNTPPDVGKKSGWGGRDGYILLCLPRVESDCRAHQWVLLCLQRSNSFPVTKRKRGLCDNSALGLPAATSISFLPHTLWGGRVSALSLRHSPWGHSYLFPPLSVKQKEPLGWSLALD